MASSGIILTAVILFVCGLLSGYLMHRSDFCMTRAFRDLFLFRYNSMLKALLILVATAALLFEIESWVGLIKTPFPLFGPPTPFGFFGGILFGLGMVLSGGCVVGVLYKSGSGSRPAFTALIGLVVGSAIYAEFHQSIAPFVRQTKLTAHVTLPQLTSIPSVWWVLVLVGVTLYLFNRWFKSGTLEHADGAEGYIQPWRTAVMMAILIAVASAVSGMPFGITTSYLKIAAIFEQLLIPEHFATLVLFSSQPVVYAPPLIGEPLLGGAGPAFDLISLVQYPLIAGIFSGAAWSSFRLKEWAWHGHFPFSQVLIVFFGGIIMVFGARLASGCNIWHLWGGLPVFTIQSLLFMLGLFPGTWLGSQILKRVILGKG